MQPELNAQISDIEELSIDVNYLRLIALSREADLREGILFRQSKGYLCTPSSGHENLAAVGFAIRDSDHIFCHYRDRALMLARGLSLKELALVFFAKNDSSSGGRQMAGHYSAPEKNVISCASPIASQCIPAAGVAWSTKLSGKDDVTICFIGDAGLRQGEFYEALSFAIQEKLPLIFVIEDNGYGISTPTDRMNPFRIGVFADDYVFPVDGRDAVEVFNKTQEVVAQVRAGRGPAVLWISFDRLGSHTSSDDQRLYRSPEELELCKKRDPITLLYQRLIGTNQVTPVEWHQICQEIKSEVELAYAEAEKADEPQFEDNMTHIFAEPQKKRRATSFLEFTDEITFAESLNKTLSYLLEIDSRVILFGEDIEDPKGGVFKLTKGLSTRFPGRVINSPLAEATICGTAVGLALQGFVPIFELQFIDFVGPGLNQIINQMATMRWRTKGQSKCPLILLAPCGAYVKGAGPWHTQTNESMFAHVPGLEIHMPSSAVDLADILVNCANGENPVLILLPKNLFFKSFPTHQAPSIRYDRSRLIREGRDVTIVSWGNCVDIAEQASEILATSHISAEVIDLKSIIPYDLPAIAASVAKTGRVVVVHEDNKTCSLGQALISEMVTTKEIWDSLYSFPRHVCREDVLVSFNPQIAKQVVPTVEKVVEAAKLAMA